MRAAGAGRSAAATQALRIAAANKRTPRQSGIPVPGHPLEAALRRRRISGETPLGGMGG
jgi:hypothetical protein